MRRVERSRRGRQGFDWCEVLEKGVEPIVVVSLLLSCSVGVGLRLDSKASLACLTIAGVSSIGLVFAMVGFGTQEQ